MLWLLWSLTYHSVDSQCYPEKLIAYVLFMTVHISPKCDWNSSEEFFVLDWKQLLLTLVLIPGRVPIFMHLYLCNFSMLAYEVNCWMIYTYFLTYLPNIMKIYGADYCLYSKKFCASSFRAFFLFWPPSRKPL